MRNILIMAFAMIGLLALTGCNDSNKAIVVVDGEPIVIHEDYTMECGEIYKVTATSKGPSTISYTGGDDLESTFGMDVVASFTTPCNEEKVPYDATWDSKTCTDNGYFFCTIEDKCLNQPLVGGTCPTDGGASIMPVPDKDGKCPTGFKSTDCGTCIVDKADPVKCGAGTELDDSNTCVVTPDPKCGAGQVYNPDTKLCDVIPALDCEKGFAELNDACAPIRYIPVSKDKCIDGYTWKDNPKLNIGGICKLTSEL